MKQLPIYEYVVSLDYIDIEKLKYEYHLYFDIGYKRTFATYYLEYLPRVERFLLEDCSITCYKIQEIPWKGKVIIYFYYPYSELPSAFSKLNAVVEHKEEIENYTLKHKTLKDFNISLYKRKSAIYSYTVELYK